MIEVDRLTKRFGPVTAVDELSFTVRPGHVTGFLGPNGAGKTTTMRLILGLDAPTSGTARVNARRYAELIRPLHQVGALLDATALHGGRTAGAHITSVAQSNGIGRGRVTEVLALTGLEAVAGRRVRGLSPRRRTRSPRCTRPGTCSSRPRACSSCWPGPPSPCWPPPCSSPAATVTRQVFTVSRRGGDRKPAVRVVLDALAEAAARS
jgi:ABC transporter